MCHKDDIIETAINSERYFSQLSQNTLLGATAASTSGPLSHTQTAESVFLSEDRQLVQVNAKITNLRELATYTTTVLFDDQQVLHGVQILLVTNNRSSRCHEITREGMI